MFNTTNLKQVGMVSVPNFIPSSNYETFVPPILQPQRSQIIGEHIITNRAEWESLLTTGNILNGATIKFKNTEPLYIQATTLYLSGRTWFEMIGAGSIDFGGSTFVVKDGKATMDFCGEQSNKQIKNLLIWGSVGGNDVVDTSANNGRWLFRMLGARNLTFDNISVNAALGSGDHIFDCSGGQNIYIYNTIIRGGVINWDGNDDLIRKELDRNWHDCLAEAIQFDYNYEGALGGFVVGDPERWQDREVYKSKKYDYSGVRNLHLDDVVLSSFKGQRASDYLAKNGKIIHTAAGTIGSHVSPKVTETTVGLDIYVDNVHFENVATNKSNRGWGLEAPIHIQNPDERNTPNYRHDSLTVGTATFNTVTRHNFGWAPNGTINLQSDMSVIYANISGNYAQEEEVHVDNPSGGSSSLHFYKKNNLVQVSLRGSWDVTQAGYNTARGVVPPRFRPVMSVFIGGVDSNSGRAFKIRFEPDGTIKTYTPSGTYTGLWLETSAVYLSNAM